MTTLPPTNDFVTTDPAATMVWLPRVTGSYGIHANPAIISNSGMTFCEFEMVVHIMPST